MAKNRFKIFGTLAQYPRKCESDERSEKNCGRRNNVWRCRQMAESGSTPSLRSSRWGGGGAGAARDTRGAWCVVRVAAATNTAVKRYLYFLRRLCCRRRVPSDSQPSQLTQIVNTQSAAVTPQTELTGAVLSVSVGVVVGVSASVSVSVSVCVGVCVSVSVSVRAISTLPPSASSLSLHRWSRSFFPRGADNKHE